MKRRAIRSLLLPVATSFLLLAACDGGKADAGKADGGKADDGKADAGKADEGKADEGKAADTTGGEPAGGDTTGGGETAGGETGGGETGGGETGGETGGGETGGGDDGDKEDTKAGGEEPKPKTTTKTDGGSKEPAAPKADGKGLYMAKCKSCHGDDGKGDTTIGKKVDIPSLAGTKLSKSKITEVVEKGVDGTKMKGYKDKLSKDEIDAVSAYVKKL